MNENTYYDVNLEARWVFSNQAGESLGANMFALLGEIETTGKLTEAAKACGMSYRHAWNQLQRWEAFFGVALVKLHKGRGAHLSILGEKLMWAKKRIDAQLEPELKNVASDINLYLQSFGNDHERPLRINASHGYAVALLPDYIKSPSIELRFTSAEDALRSLAAGDCDLAGFHVPENGTGFERIKAFDHYLNDEDFGLLRFVQRRQGLIVAKDNPFGVGGVTAVVNKNLRFVNRQGNSGTRYLFDQLLTKNAISPDDLSGYTNEEFTHSAVAAHIAAGMADVGFGVEQAARQFDLDFIPQCQEEYLFAFRKASLLDEQGVYSELDRQEHANRIDLFCEQLKSESIQEAIANLSGYKPRACGELIQCSDL